MSLQRLVPCTGAYQPPPVIFSAILVSQTMFYRFPANTCDSPFAYMSISISIWDSIQIHRRIVRSLTLMSLHNLISWHWIICLDSQPESVLIIPICQIRCIKRGMGRVFACYSPGVDDMRVLFLFLFGCLPQALICRSRTITLLNHHSWL